MNRRLKLKYAIAIVFFITVIIIVIAISTNKEEIVLDKGEEYVTSDYLIKRYEMEEKEIDGIDIEDILKRYPVKVKSYENIDSKEVVLNILKGYQEMVNDDKVREKLLEDVNMSYLVLADEYTGEYPDFSTVKYIVYSVKDEMGYISCLFDLEKSLCYEADGATRVYEDYTQSSIKGILSENDKNRLIKALINNKVDSWEHRYGSKTAESTWEMGIEFQDGTVISYCGSGGKGGAPENKSDVTDEYFDVIQNSYRDFFTLTHIEYIDHEDNRIFDVDFENMKSHIRDVNLDLDNNRELDEEDKDKIIQIIMNGKINEWEQIDNFESFIWSMNFEFSDGKKITHGKTPNSEALEGSEEVINLLIDILSIQDDQDD